MWMCVCVCVPVFVRVPVCVCVCVYAGMCVCVIRGCIVSEPPWSLCESLVSPATTRVCNLVSVVLIFLYFRSAGRDLERDGEADAKRLRPEDTAPVDLFADLSPEQQVR